MYSPKETEAILGVSHATVYRLITAGKLDARKLLGKTAITADSIERFVAELIEDDPYALDGWDRGWVKLETTKNLAISVGS